MSSGTGTRQKNRSCLPPHLEAREELGKRSSIERFAGPHVPLFSPATTSLLRLVCQCQAGRLDL